MHYQNIVPSIAAEKCHLALKEGDVVQLLDKSDDEWWQGRCDGREGLFPKASVKLVCI